MNILIRPMCGADVPRLAQIEREIFSLPWSEKAFEELLSHPYCLYLVAEADGEVAGCAGMTMLGDEGDIDKVMVQKEFRKRGIALEMLQKLLAEGQERGITAFTLEVRAGNAPAIALYEKTGFLSEGIRPRFYAQPTEDAVIMWRRQ
jgi:ribosomal-protein-alanine N-acetyltransferase